jgi:small-conductance mechanosensitive channel
MEFQTENWLLWAVGLILAVPIAILLLNEVIHGLQNRSPHLVGPIKQLKNVVLPLFATIFLTTHVFNFTDKTVFIKLITTVAWMLLVNALLAIVNTILFENAGEGTWQARVPKLFLDLFRVILVLIGGAIILSSVWGADLSNLATALGLGSFVLGLALQDTLGNLFSGIALYYEKPFQVGDNIKVGEHSGKIIEMNWRAVRILTREEEMVVIPHLVIAKDPIINFSNPTTYYIHKKMVVFGYDDPPNRVKKMLLDCLKSTPGVLPKPAPRAKTNDFKDSAIEYELEFAVADYLEYEDITDDLVSRIWYAAKRENLQMPYPQMVYQRAKMPETLAERLEKVLQDLPSIIPIDRRRIKDLADGVLLQYFGEEEILLKENEVNDSLFIIIEGEAEQFTHDIEGNEIHLINLKHGEFFGESALLGSRPNPTSVRAISDLEVLVILPAEVTEMLEKNPALAVQLDGVLESRRILKETVTNRHSFDESD